MACFIWRCEACGFENAEITGVIDDQDGKTRCSYCRTLHQVEYKVMVTKIEISKL